MARTFFRHFHLPDVPSPSLTFVIQVDEGNESEVQVFSFAWSLCAAEDNFSRKVGRELALKRLNDNDSLVGLRDHSGPLIEDLLDTIAAQHYAQPDPFYIQTIEALETYHQFVEIQDDLNYGRYVVGLPLWKRVMLWVFGKTIVQRVLGW